MRLAVCDLLDPSLCHAAGDELHEQALLLGTAGVEGDVAILAGALNAGTVAAVADATGELPTCSRDLFDVVDWLQEHRVGKLHLGDPEGTEHVSPSAVGRLLEGTASVWTEDTADHSGWRVHAPPA